VVTSVQRLVTKRINCNPLNWINRSLRLSGDKPEWHVVYPLRPNSDLPFYCRPLALFFSIWVLMLGALALHITEVSYPTMGIPLALCALSSISFIFGYALTALACKSVRCQSQQFPSIDLDVHRLRTCTSVMLLCVCIIVVANIFIDGLPPLFGLFSFDTVTYDQYGRLKQVLFPLLICVFVNAVFEPSIWRRVGLMVFSFATLLLYVTRGNLTTALCQVLIVLSLTSAMRKRAIYILGSSFTLVALGVATVLGNARTPLGVFLEYLQIKQSYRAYPTLFLWLTAYASIPISNMAWIVHNYQAVRPTWSFTYSLLPSFWMPDNPHKLLLESCNCIIDGVHTYLSEYYLDLSYAGIVGINLLIGIVSGYIVARGVSRTFLVAALFLTCIVFMYFSDMFTELSTLINWGLQFAVLKYCFSSTQSALGQRG